MVARVSAGVIVTWTAGIVSAMIAFLPALGYFLLSYQNIAGRVEAEAEINGRIVTLIVNQNPEFWQFEQTRLMEYLSRRPRRGEAEVRRVVNTRNEVVVQSADPLPSPLIQRSFALADSGVVVGELQILRSLRPLVFKTMAVELLALPLAVMVLLVVRTFPVRSIYRAEKALTELNEELRSANSRLLREIEERTRAEEEARVALNEKEILLKEIHHRVKNNLQIISSLLNLQSGYPSDLKSVEVLRTSMDRIRSMALIHDRLYHSRSLAHINVADYVKDLVSGLASSYSTGRSIMVDVDIDSSFSVNIDTAIPCGLLLNELIANSLKHAFPGRDEGVIFIGLTREGAKYSLIVSDNGIGFPADKDFKEADSLGMILIVTLVEQLEGTIDLDRGVKGTEFRITFSTTA